MGYIRSCNLLQNTAKMQWIDECVKKHPNQTKVKFKEFNTLVLKLIASRWNDVLDLHKAKILTLPVVEWIKTIDCVTAHVLEANIESLTWKQVGHDLVEKYGGVDERKLEQLLQNVNSKSSLTLREVISKPN